MMTNKTAIFPALVMTICASGGEMVSAQADLDEWMRSYNEERPLFEAAGVLARRR